MPKIFFAADPLKLNIQDSLPNVGLDSGLTSIINTLLLVAGVLAVLFVIIGGLRYALSGGNSQATKGAKDTILYALVGLLITMAAFAIVNFVLDIG